MSFVVCLRPVQGKAQRHSFSRVAEERHPNNRWFIMGSDPSVVTKLFQPLTHTLDFFFFLSCCEQGAALLKKKLGGYY